MSSQVKKSSKHPGKERKSSSKRTREQNTSGEGVGWSEYTDQHGYDQEGLYPADYYAGDIPRHPQDLVEGLENLSIHSESSLDAAASQYQYSEPYDTSSYDSASTAYPPDQHGQRTESQSTWGVNDPGDSASTEAESIVYATTRPGHSAHESSGTSHHKGKGTTSKGKHYDEQTPVYETTSHNKSSKSAGKGKHKAGYDTELGVPPRSESHFDPAEGNTSVAQTESYQLSSLTPGTEQETFYADTDEPSLEDEQYMTAVNRSKLEYSNSAFVGESSMSGSSHGYSPYIPTDEDRSLTPTPKDHASSGKERNLFTARPGQPGRYEWDDPRYTVQPSSAFEMGIVFKVLWPEPMGVNTKLADMPISEFAQINEGGKLFHVGIRRFIVVNTEVGNSTCVPIVTYGKQGCKKGAKPERHGIVYTPPSKPRLMQDEPKLGMSTVRCQLFEEGEKLSPASRVNYAKLVTVEHNWEVLIIGQILRDDIYTIEYNVNVCWEERKQNRHQQRKRQDSGHSGSSHHKRR